MIDVLNKAVSLSNEINRSISGLNEYRLISDFGTSSLSRDKSKFINYFRTFTPVKEESGRKLNSIYGSNFNVYKDTLMDYPTIVQYKLNKGKEGDWKRYNNLISVQVPRCPINCWHCYLSECFRFECDACNQCGHQRKVDQCIQENWFTAKQILNDFLIEREGSKSNVLRITGGEPYLVLELIFELLREIEDRKLSNDIFVWTETNLIPFIEDDGTTIVTDKILSRLSKYENFCIHPCFHGLDATNFEENTGQNINFDYLLKALSRLLKAKIDIYPSFGSNVCPPALIEKFFDNIYVLNKHLPLRSSLVEYDLDYEPVKERRKNPKFAKTHEKVYDRFQNIQLWNDLLIKNFGLRYGDIPRHKVIIYE